MRTFENCEVLVSGAVDDNIILSKSLVAIFIFLIRIKQLIDMSVRLLYLRDP